jgi:hypothetical protein
MPCTRVAALVLVVSAFAASGCGGSTKSSSQATSPAPVEPSSHTESTVQATTQANGKALTSAELIAKADKICGRIIAKVLSKVVKTPQEAARVEPQNAAYQRTALGELGKLTPPASLASDWKQILTAIQLIIINTDKLGEYAKANNVKGMSTTLIAGMHVPRQMLTVAKRDGFKACENVG